MNRFIYQSILLCIFFVLIFSCGDEPEYSKPSARFVHIGLPSGATSRAVNDLIFDKSGNMWAALSLDGIGEYNGTSWTLHKPLTQSPNTPFALLEADNGNIWANCFSEACYFDGQDWTIVPRPLSSEYGDTMAEMPFGIVWFSERYASGGIHIFDGEDWSFSNCETMCWSATAVFTDRDHNLWIGAASKIFKYDGVTYSEMNFSGNVTVVNFSQGSSGRIFAALSSGGAWVLEGNTWQSVLPVGYESGPIHYVLEDSQGRIWAAGETKGIILKDGDKIVAYTSERDGEFVSKIVEDKDGTIWAAGSTGIQRYEKL